MSENNEKPRAVSNAPAPISPLRGGNGLSGVPLRPTIVEKKAPAWPTVPTGYTTFPAIKLWLTSCTETNGVEGDCSTVSLSDNHLAKLLSGDELRACGISASTGELVWLPAAAWRLCYVGEDGKSGELSAIEHAFAGNRIQVRGPNLQRRSYYPLLSLRELTQVYGREPLPDAPKLVPSECVLKLVATAGAPASPVKFERSQEAPHQSRSKDRGGVSPTHDWDTFWIEVVQWAAMHDLEPEIEQRRQLQRHMVDWFHNKSGDDAPDERTIRGKLSALFTSYTQRRVKPS